jgi:hypothetical protein
MPDEERKRMAQIIVKDVNASAKKWSTRANAASGDYTTGVASTQKDQASLAADAAPLWAASVQQAVANGTFQKGVLKAGTAAWKNGVATKGSQRYGQGVAAAGNNYATGVAPFFAALQSVNLPPRNPKGNNAQRSQMVVDALIKAKLAS